MINKTRKRIWPVSLMAIALVGVLAVFAAMAVAPNGASAHEGVVGPTHCADLGELGQLGHDEDPQADHTCATGSGDGTDPVTGNGDGDVNGDVFMHATMPMDFWLEALDNGARLSWEMPETVAPNASIVGYQIDRDAWHSMDSHPINMYGDATIDVDAYMTEHRDLGLSYETVYTYMTRAVVKYNVEGWWNMLGCVQMNDAVTPTGDEPAVGAATAGTAYCRMYDDLSAEAMPVVQRAYAALDPKMYTYYGAWSEKRSLETADSGGRLEALLDPPTMVRMLSLNDACDNLITVRWSAPAYFGTVPELNERGVYVGPDYIGGEQAGKEEVGEDGTSVTYQVQRMVNNGAWVAVTPVGRSFTDDDVAYGDTYKYRVRAMNGASLTGPWAMIMETLKEPDSPQRPSSLVATHGVSSENPNQPVIILQWDAPVDNTAAASTPDPLWRYESDVYTDMDNVSRSLQYQVQRKIGDDVWRPVKMQPHQYAQDMTAMAAINNFRTQRYEDSDDAALDATEVSYRVAALVDGCNLSAWNLVDDVEGEPQARALGTITNLALSNALVLSWTPAANAASQIAIVINAVDDTDYCLAPALAGSTAFYTCSGVSATAGTAYVGLVIALDGSGGSSISNFPIVVVR